LADNAGLLGAWLDAAPGTPFFVLLHGFDAHKPYRARPVDRRALGLGERPSRSLERACKRGGDDVDRRVLTDDYDAAVHRADAGVGKLLAVLAQRGLLDRTLVIVTADHGEELFDHGGCFHLRTLYREILHVPLVVRVPGAKPRRVRGVVPASVSIGATVLELLGAPETLPGPSLARVLDGAAPAFGYVLSETQTHATLAMRSGAVRALTGDRDKIVAWSASGRVEYFDLVRDPGERRPSMSDSRARPLLARLDAWDAARVPGAVQLARPIPADVRRRLTALGYLD
jgi:arylsulfatase A-like enzyme